MTAVDELIYNAIAADAELLATIGGRVRSTCFEVSPEEVDKTPLPCIIVTDDGFQGIIETKDEVWDTDQDRVTASVEVDAASPKDVRSLVKRVRKAVNDYICDMADMGEDIPELQSVTSEGIAWDWTKPCYHQTISYNVITQNDYEREGYNESYSDI